MICLITNPDDSACTGSAKLHVHALTRRLARNGLVTLATVTSVSKKEELLKIVN